LDDHPNLIAAHLNPDSVAEWTFADALEPTTIAPMTQRDRQVIF
jgi:hypothetical protein